MKGNPLFNLLAILLIAVICFLSFWRSPKDQVSKMPQVKSVKLKKPLVIEIIVPNDSVFNSEPLFDLAKGFALDINDITQWKNHIAIYADISNPEDLLKRIKSAYPNPEDTIRIFDAPFYTFNRKRCADTISSKKWQNILLSASLVNDPKLQQEYLNYHATQFQKWPEVSNGFCNANFQQLLVFKNGRQLMLIISIPKGESLDKLNPKTTENNPRVDEWNKLMKKYQEGLPGTKPGEVWVFFKPLKNQ
jgi:L-rhamnose mutarotase